MYYSNDTNNAKTAVDAWYAATITDTADGKSATCTVSAKLIFVTDACGVTKDKPSV